MLKRICTYLTYFFTAHSKRGHGIHSPFVYTLTNKVIGGDLVSAEFAVIEGQRKLLLRSKEKVKKTVPGTVLPDGSHTIKVKSVASIALCSPYEARFLYRIMTFCKPSSILEIGTSLGMTTQYLALANSTTPVITLEGNPDIARIAAEQFAQNKMNNIILIPGDFSQTLPGTIARLESPFVAFIDGNHFYQPTMKYFNLLKDVAGNDSVLIFHDIHHSHEMNLAWQQIKHDDKVRMTIDLYRMGLVFFKSELLVPQHFKIKF